MMNLIGRNELAIQKLRDELAELRGRIEALEKAKAAPAKTTTTRKAKK